MKKKKKKVNKKFWKNYKKDNPISEHPLYWLFVDTGMI